MLKPFDDPANAGRYALEQMLFNGMLTILASAAVIACAILLFTKLNAVWQRRTYGGDRRRYRRLPKSVQYSMDQNAEHLLLLMPLLGFGPDQIHLVQQFYADTRLGVIWNSQLDEFPHVAGISLVSGNDPEHVVWLIRKGPNFRGGILATFNVAGEVPADRQTLSD